VREFQSVGELANHLKPLITDDSLKYSVKLDIEQIVFQGRQREMGQFAFRIMQYYRVRGSQNKSNHPFFYVGTLPGSGKTRFGSESFRFVHPLLKDFAGRSGGECNLYSCQYEWR